MDALLVSGPVASGKTIVLEEIGALLDDAGAPYALIDLDWLAWAAPPDGDIFGLLLRNLAAVWANLRASAIERVVMARYVESEGQLDAIRVALGPTALAVVVLDVPKDELERRIRARDRSGAVDEHLAMLREAGAAIGGQVVPATGDPRAIARAVLDAAGWRF